MTWSFVELWFWRLAVCLMVALVVGPFLGLSVVGFRVLAGGALVSVLVSLVADARCLDLDEEVARRGVVSS